MKTPFWRRFDHSIYLLSHSIYAGLGFRSRIHLDLGVTSSIMLVDLQGLEVDAGQSSDLSWIT